ncbi:MAG: DNA alkylation repair protein [Myxococcota bacterium]
MNDQLRSALDRALKDRANPTKATAMQAYMKSAMPFLGVASPERKLVYKEVFSRYRLPDAPAWRTAARALWDGATHREYRYAAIGLLNALIYRSFRSLEAFALYEHMIVDGAWWDYVDEVAVHLVGSLLRKEPEVMSIRMREWAVDQNLWRRRTSIICQLGAKEAVDLRLLYDCIEPSIESKEFFARKAIGWALRQVARRQPDEVVRYVQAHADRLSGLSKREALKHLLQRGDIDAIP